ncbi:putative lipase/esterase [Mycobacteroides stephanolepidis]|uniref:Putative lipase/esterase n=1 Tax=[Mycobacterium] stephanolepidis TaxID=1520670 RepID=A0A1Z4ERQ5_9MYCO|nr:putative lipase/esterase [[Mycobacterium] stephanolepidis]
MTVSGSTRYRYGNDAGQQYVDMWASQSARGLAILVHGGYWRSTYSADVMEPLIADLVARGWDVANVEYRRVGSGGGYPITLQDAAAGIECAVRTRANSVERTALVGHSVGGELSLLNAKQVDLVLALAPVTDVRRTFDEDLGDSAAGPFMGATPGEDPAGYQLASPRWQLPITTPVLITHGVDDDRVPIEHSRSYRDAAVESGCDVELREFENLPHGDEIDPNGPHWLDAVVWLTTKPL